MNRYLVIVIIIVFAAICIAQIQQVSPVDKYQQMTQPGQLYTEQKGWVVINTALSAGDEPNDLAVTERTYTTIIAAAEGGDSKISIYGDDGDERLEMTSWNGVRFQCIGISDNNTVTFQIYFGSLEVGDTDCSFSYAGQLAFTIGTQVSTTSTYEYADTLTATAGQYGPWDDESPASERVAEASIDMKGDFIIVAVPTTVSCNAKLLAKGY